MATVRALSTPRRTKPQRDTGPRRLLISGFKSIRDEQAIELRPLTLLAGQNSSGKSSAMQPLLLMKQTLEASYDAGPLRIDGPNARFTYAEQLFWHGSRGSDAATEFSIGIAVGARLQVRVAFARTKVGIRLDRMEFDGADQHHVLREGMSDAELRATGVPERPLLVQFRDKFDPSLKLRRAYCFLEVASGFTTEGQDFVEVSTLSPSFALRQLVDEFIHLPGLRGNPERAYPAARVAGAYPGLFQNYAASIITEWHELNADRLAQLEDMLAKLGLTARVLPKRLDDTRVELRVGRLPKGRGDKDLVNIADVGFGVSQALPLLVALLAARKGQVVYVEQPEIHLHPRAQVDLAHLLLQAAQRGVIVVAETHSNLLIQSVQTAIASGEFAPSLVKLHWFTRDKQGATRISVADLDESGAFGPWPEDLSAVELDIEGRYLDAVGARRGRA